jgi:hypothetical protein
MSALAVVTTVPTLDELAATALSEFDRVRSSESDAFGHAIRCGEALNAALERMERREFYAWRRDLFKGRARNRPPLFQRMAARQDELRRQGITTIHQADVALRGDHHAGAHTRARAQRARRALRRQERAAAMRKIGGKAEEAFSLVVKAQQELDRLEIEDPEKRRLVASAYMDLTSAEEKIWKAVAVK